MKNESINVAKRIKVEIRKEKLIPSNVALAYNCICISAIALSDIWVPAELIASSVRTSISEFLLFDMMVISKELPIATDTWDKVLFMAVPCGVDLAGN